jgi:hypothetical protein
MSGGRAGQTSAPEGGATDFAVVPPPLVRRPPTPLVPRGPPWALREQPLRPRTGQQAPEHPLPHHPVIPAAWDSNADLRIRLNVHVIVVAESDWRTAAEFPEIFVRFL